ncbi:FANCA protein, partial [Polypterus senegalus]
MNAGFDLLKCQWKTAGKRASPGWSHAHRVFISKLSGWALKHAEFGTAERSLKRKPVPENEKELQEAAVHLFNRHQNLGDLLVEENPVPYKKTYLDEENKSGKSRFSAKITNGDSLLVSALYDLASTYGIPVGVLAARKVVEKILELFLTYDESSQSVLLTSEKREILVCLTKSVKELRSQNAFSRQIFCQEMWSAKHSLPLELVWYLHKENITSLEEFLESNRNCVAVSGWLFRNLNLLCGEMNRETDICHCILSDVVTVLVRYSFQEANDKEPSVKLKRIHQVCFTTMNEMLSSLPGVAEVLGSRVPQAPGRRLAVATGTYRVGLPSPLPVAPNTTRAIAPLQSGGGTSPPLVLLGVPAWLQPRPGTTRDILAPAPLVVATVPTGLGFQARIKVYDVRLYQGAIAAASLRQFFTHSLTYILTYKPQFKELLSRLLKNAFENYDTESLITAFLLVRQASLEGPAVFNSYSDWFKNSFGNASSYHGNCKKSLVFLLKFLSDLVPFEPPQYLKVHVFYPPYVPAKYRSSLLEYITVAKTRLSDLKVQCQAEKDVEKAIALFENSGRIPASVMEASCPTSLTLRYHSLNPYESAFQEMGIAQLQEPCQLLNTALEELNCLISGQSKLEDITPQISLISNHLRNIIPHNSNESYLNMPLKLDILTPKLEPLENKGSSLTGVHILGLSAFVIHFHESKIKVTLVNSGVDCDNLIDFAECLNKLMLCNSEESMTFCSRFCTAALTYGFCVWNFASVEEIKACIPKGFCKKIQYIIPRLYAEVRFGSFEDEITRNIVPPSCGWKKSALALYNYHKLKELVMLPEFKLTFKDWIMAELDVQPGKDFLLDMERQEYQRWICYQQYLSSSFIFGGFAGDLESECSAIINTLVDHSQRSLCGEVNRPPSDSPFVLASFLYFSFLKRTDNCSMTAVLGTMCDDNEQDNMDLAKVQKCCTDIVKCLEDVGQMLVIFNDSGAEQEINKTMKKMMSDVEIQMLPFAFYSLDLKVRDCILQHKDFLRTVLRMYIELLKLSFDGCSSESKEEQSYEQINVIELVTTAKKFLLQVISQTPERNIFNRKQLEAICGNHDPEVKAALAFRLQATGNDFLDGPDFV